MDDLRKERKLTGLCSQCGHPLDREGMYCKRCNAMNNKSKFKYSHDLHQQGKCTDCGKDLDRVGWFCTSCITKSNARARERNAYRRENSLCVTCGVKVTFGSYCRDCLDKRMERYWRKRKMLHTRKER